MLDPKRNQKAHNLLEQAGFLAPYQLEVVPGGGNNQVYRVYDSKAQAAFLKLYFHHTNDPRDRLGNEFSFSTYAWSIGIRCLPQPLAMDDAWHMGLYEYLVGSVPNSQQIGQQQIQQAIQFFLNLNQIEHRVQAKQLPLASEATFSFRENLKLIEKRIQKLLILDQSSGPKQKAVAFVNQELWPRFKSLQQHILSDLSSAGMDLDEALAWDQRCVSPSDFGFHNALFTAQGLKFVDFEYAGIDDPAKMICDFFCQPKIPVPTEHFELFIQQLSDHNIGGPQLRERTYLLEPLYRVKWSCICLNDFLPDGNHRRQFATGTTQSNRLENQLTKARKMLTPVLEGRR